MTKIFSIDDPKHSMISTAAATRGACYFKGRWRHCRISRPKKGEKAEDGVADPTGGSESGNSGSPGVLATYVYCVAKETDPALCFGQVMQSF